MIQSLNRFIFPVLMLLLATPGTSTAQESQPGTKQATMDSVTTTTRGFQLSFITPLGTNGLHSWNTTNAFSLNIVAGYAGGVHGVEFSGLTSVIRSNVKGAQFAGLGQVVLGETQGAQFAGFGNVAAKQAKGLQAAGFGNYAGGGKVTQMSGFSNISVGANAGLQITGFANVHAGTMKGVQIAGASNINAGYLKGVQISGLVNFAGKLNGLQIAPFNVVDSLEHGVPIGVLSFVGNGYIGAEFSATETMYGVFSFKTGIRKFYNILSVGAGYRDDLIVWGWGYGVGGMTPITERWDLSIEGLCYQMNEGEWFTNRLNLLNKLSAAASWKFSKGAALFAGLSWNVTVSDITDEYGDPVTPHIAPWSVYDETHGRINIRMFPGITAGIRL